MLCGIGVSAGKGFMPFHKQCSTDIKNGGVVSNRWWHFVHGQALNIHWLRGTNNFVIQKNKRIAYARYQVINHCSYI